MAEQIQPNPNQQSDEIDLAQLFKLISKGIDKIGNLLLRVYIYIRKRILKLIGLLIIGLAISYGLSQIVSKKQKTEVIVRPNFESKNYVYEVVSEIDANLKELNPSFFEKMDVAVEDLKGFKIEINAIEDEVADKAENELLNEIEYLDLLKNFKDESFVIDILRSELSEKSIVNYKITFSYNDGTKGPKIAEKMMNYINKNEYFQDLKSVYIVNAKSRIEKNKAIIFQIDDLIKNYSKSLIMNKEKSSSSAVIIEKESALNLPSLFEMKNNLLKEIEEKELELAQQTDILTIQNFGDNQVVKKSFFNQTYFLIPSLLIFGYLLISFFQYLERRSKRLKA